MLLGAGNQEGVNRSEWYSYNPMSSVTTLGGSGSDGASTLGEVDQSGQDFVLMASPIRGGAFLSLSVLWVFCVVFFFYFFVFLLFPFFLL